MNNPFGGRAAIEIKMPCSNWIIAKARLVSIDKLPLDPRIRDTYLAIENWNESTEHKARYVQWPNGLHCQLRFDGTQRKPSNAQLVRAFKKVLLLCVDTLAQMQDRQSKGKR